MTSQELKENYRIPTAWSDLRLPGQPGKACRSPFPGEHRNGDANPSFSVFDDGRQWKDFATGSGGDVIDLVRKTLGCSDAEAFRFVRERLGLVQDVNPSQQPTLNRAPRKAPFPTLRLGTRSEFQQLGDLRGFAENAMRLAEERGLLRFTEHFGKPAWCVTDGRRQLVELRRLDGKPWDAFGRLPARKSHCIGSGKRWPIGTLESTPFPKVVLVEGAPDLIAAFHFIVVEAKEASVAAVACLGASNHFLDPQALQHFAGKVIRIFPHLDTAGFTASRAWARALKEAGVGRVEGFNLSRLTTVDGTGGKDLADVIRIDPDCFETERKFWNLLP